MEGKNNNKNSTVGFHIGESASVAITVSNPCKIQPENEKSTCFKKWPQFLAAFCASLGGFCLGTMMGWTSPVFPQLIEHGLNSNQDLTTMEMENNSFQDKTVERDIKMQSVSLTPDQLSWIASLAILGCVFATIPTGIIIGNIGRRMTILTLSIPLFFGWVLIIIADSVRLLYTGRLITGFCCGAFSIAVPVYVGEIASKEYRGILGSFFALQVVNGVLFSYAVGSLVDWMWLSILCSCVPFLLVVSMTFMPNSPVYLLSINKVEEAAISLQWLKGAQNIKEIEPELQLLQLNQENAANGEMSVRDYLDGSIWKPLLLCVGIHMLQQLTGISTLVVYCASIFETAGTTMSPSVCSIVVGVAQVFGVAVSTILIEKAGRRSLLIVSSVTMGISWITLGIFFYMKEQNEGEIPDGFGLVPLISLVGSVVFFSVGLGPIPWTLLGEILPHQIRGTGASIATLFNWLLSFFITKIYDDISVSVGAHTIFFIFSGFCLLAALFTHAALPETKNKEYDEIQKNFAKK